MKTCAYCGRKNEDSAAACAECGTDEFVTTPPFEILTTAPPSIADVPVAATSEPIRGNFLRILRVGLGAFFLMAALQQAPKLVTTWIEVRPTSVQERARFYGMAMGETLLAFLGLFLLTRATNPEAAYQKAGAIQQA